MCINWIYNVNWTCEVKLECLTLLVRVFSVYWFEKLLCFVDHIFLCLLWHLGKGVVPWEFVFCHIGHHKKLFYLKGVWFIPSQFPWPDGLETFEKHCSGTGWCWNGTKHCLSWCKTHGLAKHCSECYCKSFKDWLSFLLVCWLLWWNWMVL